MLRIALWTGVLSLLLAGVAAGQSTVSRELPEAPSSHLPAGQPPALSWMSTTPESDYVPLTSREKLSVFVTHTYSPRTFVGAGFDAGISQATSGHEGYGAGWEGYGKRYGASLADGESGVLFQRFLLPTLFHQDPRYFRRPDLPTGRRVAYAISRLLWTRQDDGRTGINVSYLGGGLLASAVSNAYYPFHERGISDTFSRFGSGMLSDAGMNIWHEFWPNIKRRLLRTRAAQRLEQSKLGAKIVTPDSQADGEQNRTPSVPGSCDEHPK